MNHPHTAPRQPWGTASRNDANNSSSSDLLVLEDHLSACPQMHRHLLTLHGAAASVHGFVATRFVTTMVIVAVLFSFGYWVL